MNLQIYELTIVMVFFLKKKNFHFAGIAFINSPRIQSDTL